MLAPLAATLAILALGWALASTELLTAKPAEAVLNSLTGILLGIQTVVVVAAMYVLRDRAGQTSTTTEKPAAVLACDETLIFQIVEDERRRVSKELHDEILPALVRMIRSIQKQNSQGTTNNLVEALQATVAAFRDLLGELHPVDLDECGLVQALTNLCARYARMTGLLIVFKEKVEECPLPPDKQLAIYRAMQATLRMFGDSDNDILIVSFDRVAGESIVFARCIDKRVSSAHWLSDRSPHYLSFATCCRNAGASVSIGATEPGEFPCDLVISVPE